MIEEIKIQNIGVGYKFSDKAPDDAEDQLAEAGYPTNPTTIRRILDS